MPVKKLKEYLDRENVKFVTTVHSAAFTAQEIAAAAHVSGKYLAKTVIVRLDGRTAMAVLPANRKVIMEDLRELTRAVKINFATEDEFQKLFPECEIGAMPPFGNLYGLEVFVDSTLAEDEEISFNAGSHTELVKLAYKDFERLVKPTVAKFTT